MRRKFGFTLIEILVALLIFAIMAVITASVLRTVLATRERLNIHSLQYEQLQAATTLIQQDISQIINRSISDNKSNNQPALIGLINRIDFTRAGFNNPLAIGQSTLQRVAYYLKDGNLVRAYWLNLDQKPNDKPIEKIILPNVTNLEFGYLGEGSGFSQTWFMANAQSKLPRAIKVKLILKQLGELNLLIAIPSGFSLRVSL